MDGQSDTVPLHRRSSLEAGNVNQVTSFITPPLVQRRSIAMSVFVCACMYVCMPVCMSARISPEPHVRMSRIVCILPAVVARSLQGVMLGTSGFTDDVILHIKVNMEARRYNCSE